MTESSSGKKQEATDDAAQSGASSSATSDSNKSSQTTRDSQSDAPVPAALVGTWTGTSPQATDISFTVDANGNVTSKANFNVDYEPYRQSSTTAKAVQISGNLYVWEGGDFSTLLPGITGLGELVSKLSLVLFLKMEATRQFNSFQTWAQPLIIATTMLSHSH